MSAVTCLRLTSCLRLGLVKQLTTVTNGPRCRLSVEGATRLCRPNAFSLAPEIRQLSHVLGPGREDLISGHWITGVRHLSLSGHSYSVDKNSSRHKGNQQEPEIKKDDDKVPPEATPAVAQDLTVVQKLKKMFKEYWYVLLPVHISTSAIWLGSFYYMAKSGIDIVPLIEYLGASEIILKPLRSTGAGYWAVTYAFYKLASPARYAVTLGGTTVAINYLNRWGLIKPMPTSDQMKAMFQDRQTQFRTRRAQRKSAANDKSSTTKSDSSET